ncbi:MAG TPA: tyrosine-type recombinase/integrase [Pseudonocardiaceae bacterium]|jgi:site-specific recombinase XerC|nr:tyrosine-type recombinase/integrase [Pseudonocardiaceae bacterium]
MIDVTRVRMSGPIAGFAAGFAAELQSLGYSDHSARAQLWLAAHMSGWMAERGLGVSELDTARIGEFVAWRRSLGRTAFRSVKALEPLLRYLRELGAAPLPVPPLPVAGPVGALLVQYIDYLRFERGVTAKTARDYAAAVRPFLEVTADSDRIRWESATPAAVTAFILEQCRHRPVRSAQMVVTGLRALLRYLHIHGLIDGSLLAAVPKVPDRRPQLPRGLPSQQVQALLRSCGPGRAGRRDYAIIVMLARLGLRAGEVAGLQLDDIDWRHGQITVRGKPERVDTLPLPVDVGDALVDYLQHARPGDALDRAVFVRVLAPHRGLTPVGVTQAVVAAGKRAGLGVVTAHRLRHSAATAMLQAGTPLAGIGQVLRHQRQATTALYIKTDIAALRTVARPWPADPAGDPV